MRRIFEILLLLITLTVRAEDPSAAKKIDLVPHLKYGDQANEELLAQTQTVVTHEQIVQLAGVRYRQIEYKGKYYWLDMRNPEISDNCLEPSFVEGHAVEGGITITKRTKLFVESLVQKCSEKEPEHLITSKNTRDTNLGIQFKGEKPGDPDRKIYVNPLQKTGGVGTTF